MSALPPPAVDGVYLISRSGWSRVLVLKESGGHMSDLLRQRRRWLPVNWTTVAQAVLTDALGERPMRKLALDFGRFLFTPRGQTRTVTGSEIERWLSSWALPKLPGVKSRSSSP